MALNQKIIEKAQPHLTPNGRKTTKSYKMGDSGGLYLEVSPSGGKWWRLKYRFQGKEKRLSLGVYPEVSLSDAREKRDSFRTLLDNGIDPSEKAKEERKAIRAEEARKLAESRFTVDPEGALSIRLGKRRLTLSPDETAELHSFLDKARSSTLKVTSWP